MWKNGRIQGKYSATWVHYLLYHVVWASKCPAELCSAVVRL